MGKWAARQTFTELLLKYFDNHYAKTAAFLG
jgi:hypothetical protein